MGGTPLRATATEEALKSGASIEEAARLAAEGTSPGYDFHADVDYREHLARVLTKRALEGKAGDESRQWIVAHTRLCVTIHCPWPGRRQGSQAPWRGKLTRHFVMISA